MALALPSTAPCTLVRPPQSSICPLRIPATLGLSHRFCCVFQFAYLSCMGHSARVSTSTSLITNLVSSKKFSLKNCFKLWPSHLHFHTSGGGGVSIWPYPPNKCQLHWSQDWFPGTHKAGLGDSCWSRLQESRTAWPPCKWAGKGTAAHTYRGLGGLLHPHLALMPLLNSQLPPRVSLDPALQAAPALAEALRYPAGLESAAPLLIQHWPPASHLGVCPTPNPHINKSQPGPQLPRPSLLFQVYCALQLLNPQTQWVWLCPPTQHHPVDGGCLPIPVSWAFGCIFTAVKA